MPHVVSTAIRADMRLSDRAKNISSTGIKNINADFLDVLEAYVRYSIIPFPLRNTSTSISIVRRPVKVFCWLG